MKVKVVWIIQGIKLSYHIIFQKFSRPLNLSCRTYARSLMPKLLNEAMMLYPSVLYHLPGLGCAAGTSYKPP
jgi:hypothetical protein